MTEDRDFEARVRATLVARAGTASRPFDAAAIAHEVVLRGRPRLVGPLGWWHPRAGTGRLLLAVLLAAALVAAIAAAGTAFRRPAIVMSSEPTNGWIAFSTGRRLRASTDAIAGTSIYEVREGSGPVLIAGSNGTTARNFCPVFSPDGQWLAYGVQPESGPLAIVVRGPIGSGDPASSPSRIVSVPSSADACVRWSADSQRIAYRDNGVVVVRGLDGSTSVPAAGDPSAGDFPTEDQASATDGLVSPKGDVAVRRRCQTSTCELIVSRVDGTSTIQLPFDPAYRIDGWSPDGRELLGERDVAWNRFELAAMSLYDPAQSVVLAVEEVNGARGWPGPADISWGRASR